MERKGLDHFTVSVMVEQSDIVGHYHAMKEIQLLGVHMNATFERTQLEINNVDSGKFKLVFMHPTTLKPVPTNDFIIMNATAAQLRAGVEPYYKATVGSTVQVSTTMYDENST